MTNSRSDSSTLHKLVTEDVTIATGVITPGKTSTYLIVDNESAGATDDLVTITKSPSPFLQIIVLSSKDSARDPTVKDGTGNIFLGGGDFTFTTTQDRLVLISGTDGVSWYELSRSDNA